MFWVVSVPDLRKKNKDETVHLRFVSRPLVWAILAVQDPLSLHYFVLFVIKIKEADYIFILKSCCLFFSVYHTIKISWIANHNLPVLSSF